MQDFVAQWCSRLPCGVIDLRIESQLGDVIFFFFSFPLYLLFFLLAFSHLFPIPNSFSIFLSLKLGEDGRDACLFS